MLRSIEKIRCQKRVPEDHLQRQWKQLYWSQSRDPTIAKNLEGPTWRFLTNRCSWPPNQMGLHASKSSALFCQIQLILNSRPICPLSEDPNDDTILTPAHLCLGGKHESLPLKESVAVYRSETIDDLSDATPVKKWAHLQNLTIHFWKRWTKAYVTSLQERNKWKQETSNLKVGDVVYVTDDNTPPLQWPLARVSYVYGGPDNFVRVVKIRTVNGIYNRSVHKLWKFFDVPQKDNHQKLYSTNC